MRNTEFHGLPREDLERIIYSLARKTCRRFNLDFTSSGQDLVQEGWLIVYRKKDSYVPRGAKFSTYIYDWIQQYMKTYALKELRASSQLATEETEERINELEAPELADVDLTDVDPLLVLEGMGFADAEIEQLTGRTNVSQLRRQARRELVRETP